MQEYVCPRCASEKIVKSGLINHKQRYQCKDCKYNFTVTKLGKQIDSYYVVKAMQLYLEGLSYREIERILGVSHVSVMNWIKKYKLQTPVKSEYRPSYKVFTQSELANYFSDSANLESRGFIITELGDKYMMISWDRYR